MDADEKAALEENLEDEWQELTQLLDTMPQQQEPEVFAEHGSL